MYFEQVDTENVYNNDIVVLDVFDAVLWYMVVINALKSFQVVAVAKEA